MPKKTASKPRGARRNNACADAFALLEVTADQVADDLQISHITKVVGDTQTLLDFLKGSNEKEAKAIVEQARKLNKTQIGAVPIEALCVAGNVPTKKLLEVLMGAVAEQGAIATQLLSKAAHPKVVQATVDAALLPDGSNDRRMLHQAEGFVPIPKTSITVNRTTNIDNRTQTQVAVLPALDDSVKKMTDRFIEAVPVPQLPAPEDE